MAQPFGRWKPLALPRRFISDLVYFSKLAPLRTMQRAVWLPAVAEARLAAARLVRPLHQSLSFMAAQRPPLRQAYMPWPWPHLYEHPIGVTSAAVGRRYCDEDAVFFAHVRIPHEHTLASIEKRLRRCKTEQIESIALFRRIPFTSRFPLPMRRLTWRFGLYTSGGRRAKHMGTFGVSATSNFGSSGLDLLTPLTTGLNYGVVSAAASVDVRLTYDHRVLDGGTAARALAKVEEVMNGAILAELSAFSSRLESSCL